MHRYVRMLIAGITGTTALAVAVGIAPAREFENSASTFRETWASLELSNTAGSGVVRCPVTLEGSMHSRTVRKTARTLIGYITRSFLNTTACTGGRATIRNETLPWHLTYESFIAPTGLPNITGIRVLIVRAGFIVFDSTSGNTCSVITESEEPASAVINISSGTFNSVSAEPNRRIRMANGPGGVFCGLASAALAGTSNSVTVLNSVTRITIRLI